MCGVGVVVFPLTPAVCAELGNPSCQRRRGECCKHSRQVVVIFRDQVGVCLSHPSFSKLAQGTWENTWRKAFLSSLF